MIKLFLHINAKKIETVISYFDNYLWNVGIQKNQQYYDKLTIDGELVYELNKPGPSTYTPSKPKKEYNSYGSSESSSSYDDGYNSAVDDGDYDHDRYNTDPSYRQGVDDGFDEIDEDY